MALWVQQRPICGGPAMSAMLPYATGLMRYGNRAAGQKETRREAKRVRPKMIPAAARHRRSVAAHYMETLAKLPI